MSEVYFLYHFIKVADVSGEVDIIGIEQFEAELVLIDPKENVKEEDYVKIAEFCAALA